MNHIKKHVKLYVLIILEIGFLVLTAMMISGKKEDLVFSPADFADNIQGRETIFLDENGISFIADPNGAEVEEAELAGENLLSGKFALGSGAYTIAANYSTDTEKNFVELYSVNNMASTVSSEILLLSDRTEVRSKIYVPVGRSMHDIQIRIHYSGEGQLSLKGIRITGEGTFNWVPIAGYLILFVFLDLFLCLLFSGSGALLRSWLRKNYEYPVIFLISVLASLPVFADFLYVGHDLEFHLARIIAVSREISYGQFPVRMLTDMLGGYGYPTSTFYCDLFLYPFSILYLLGLPLRMCWQSYVIIVNVFTALLAYYAFYRISDDRNAGIVGSFVYSLSAYRIVDIYLRSAMGEFTAMAFIPLVILGMWHIYYDDKNSAEGWGFLGIGMSGIALSHLLTLEMVALFIGLFCLLEYRRTFRRDTLICIVKAALMTLLLACWFIFPMLISMSRIDISMYEHQFYIQAEGAYPVQVFNPFMRGSGLSTTATPREMPLSLGGGIIAAFAMLIWTIMHPEMGKERKKQRMLFVLTVLSLVFSMYFFPWDSIAGITEGRIDVISSIARMVQYPWRFLEITTALLSVSSIVILKWINDEYRKTGFIWVWILVSGTILSLGSFYNPFINESKWTRADNEYYIENSIGGEEYLPSDSGAVSELTHDVEIPESADAEVLSYEITSGERRLEISNRGEETPILLPAFAYPGYFAEDMDTGQIMELSKGDRGRLSLDIPAGYAGKVRIHYEEPSSWRVFEIISLLSAVFFSAAGIRYTKNSRRKA